MNFNFTTEQWILIIIIFIYTRPLWMFRYKFRCIVYKEKGWKINFKPWFWKETKALFSNSYFHNAKEIQAANNYRIYLVGFGLLWLLFRYISP